MLKYLHNNRAQAVLGEYLLIFFIVAGMMTAMAIYFRRAIQARIYETRNDVFITVNRFGSGYYVGNLALEYEPYYTNTLTSLSQFSFSETHILPVQNTSGIFRKNIDDTSVVRTTSQTAPPSASANAN